MTSNRKKTEQMRANKRKPHKKNLQADVRRIQKNSNRLKELASEE